MLGKKGMSFLFHPSSRCPPPSSGPPLAAWSKRRSLPGSIDVGEVDQSDDVVAQGYALLYAAYSRDELLRVQLAAADD